MDGKQVCESTGTKDKTEARRILQARLGQLAEGRYVGPAVERVTVDELIQDFLTDYTVNGRKSLRMVQGKVRNHILPYFGGHKAHNVTTADVQAYIQQRLQKGASNAEIKRETAALKRAYNPGLRAGKITKKPYIPKLEADNARQGFLEPWQFDALLARLPAFLHPPVTFAYYTGWRIHSEILPLSRGRTGRKNPARLSAHSREESREGRGARTGRHDDHRPQNPVHLRPLQLSVKAT